MVAKNLDKPIDSYISTLYTSIICINKIQTKLLKNLHPYKYILHINEGNILSFNYNKPFLYISLR